MKFNMKDLNPGTWFDIPGDEDGARVCIRVCPPGELRKIQAATTTKQLKFKRGQRYTENVTDEAKEDLMLMDYCIVDWENIFDEEGTPIDCIAENKQILSSQSPEFSARCLEFLAELNAVEVGETRELEKN